MDTEVTPAGMCPVHLDAVHGHLSRRLTVHYPCGSTEVRLMSIVSLSPSGEPRIVPYTGELPFTLYHDKPLHLYLADPPALYEQK